MGEEEGKRDLAVVFRSKFGSMYKQLRSMAHDPYTWLETF